MISKYKKLSVVNTSIWRLGEVSGTKMNAHEVTKQLLEKLRYSRFLPFFLPKKYSYRPIFVGTPAGRPIFYIPTQISIEIISIFYITSI